MKTIKILKAQAWHGIAEQFKCPYYYVKVSGLINETEYFARDYYCLQVNYIMKEFRSYFHPLDQNPLKNDQCILYIEDGTQRMHLILASDENNTSIDLFRNEEKFESEESYEESIEPDYETALIQS